MITTLEMKVTMAMKMVMMGSIPLITVVLQALTMLRMMTTNISLMTMMWGICQLTM
jgi:hypothetical protein